ncbi:MAG: TIGR02266 family protein, partial [Myxococcales bacterium]|nr:TIGR02266 family protein [Myxococcales bacterium]
MSQDTRKDKRAKVVSLNVRYKSATVDEFIENHSHDISKGGLFVKTPTPFAPGTLLKFEIRLAGDKTVISGVGRVVWKREPTQSAPERPAGMGVKFIKVDDSSRVVIDRLVAEKADAGAAYEQVPSDVEEKQSTLRGIVAAKPVESSAPAAPVKVPAPTGPASKLPVPPAASPAKLGAPSSPPVAKAPPAAKPAPTPAAAKPVPAAAA